LNICEFKELSMLRQAAD